MNRWMPLLCVLGLLTYPMVITPAWSNDTEEQQHKARLNYQGQDARFKPASNSTWFAKKPKTSDKKPITDPQGKTIGYYDNAVIAVDGAVVNSRGLMGLH